MENSISSRFKPSAQSFIAVTKDDDWRLFNPRIDDDGSIYVALRRFSKLPTVEAIEKLTEYSNAVGVSTLPTLKAKVAATLLRDLLTIGWEVHTTAHHIYVRPSKHTDPSSRKALIRQQLLFGRDDQLLEDSHRRFIYSMERPSKYSSSRPVTDLIADGRRLSEQLRPVMTAAPDRRAELLRSVCQPYAQLVSDERDEFTNLRLIDIWRYFRHSWSTRYRSSPGRNLFYLIRDAAQPNHPVIGITALGNTVMQLTPRDKALGWTVDGLLDLVEQGVVSDVEILRAFRARLEEDFDQIYRDDLPVDRRIDHSVDDETLSRLAVIEQDALKDREDALKGDEDSAPKRPDDLTPKRLLELTKTPLC